MKLDATCPKCGTDNVYIRHTEDVVLKTEHMAAKCHRCEYRWRLQPLTALERAQPVAVVSVVGYCPDCGSDLRHAGPGRVVCPVCEWPDVEGASEASPLIHKPEPTPPPPARDEWTELAEDWRPTFIDPNYRVPKLAAEFRRVDQSAFERGLAMGLGRTPARTHHDAGRGEG